MNNYKFIKYEGREYAIFRINYKEHTLPGILDINDFKIVHAMNKNWHCNSNGFISCSHTTNGNTKDVYLHELVMLLKNKDNGIRNINKPIVHINRVGLDNRRENLMYDILEKDLNKNLKKKKRTVELPYDCGIDPDDIPTYVWYMKPDASHGERFAVNIGDVSWKTSSSFNLSLQYKLEEAKLFVRELLKSRNDLFDEYSMNGDYTKEGKELLHTYYDIIHFAGYKHIQRFVPENNTFDLLKPNYDALDDDEKMEFYERRKFIKNEL